MSSYAQGPSAIPFSYIPPSRRPMLPSRRLSISSNSQWTTQSPSSSGYALSPSSSSSSTFEHLRQQQQQQQQQAQSPSPHELHRRPSHGSGNSKTIRQLDPVSIFERLGLGNSSDTASSGTDRTTQLTTSQPRHHHHHHPGPSPGREDAHLPSTEFDGIPDTTEVMTPMPGSTISDTASGDEDYQDFNTGPHRKTLSNAASLLPMHASSSSSSSSNAGSLSIRQQHQSSTSLNTATGTGHQSSTGSNTVTPNAEEDAEMTISPSGSTPRNVLLDIASVPPVDIANPTIHPGHALVLDYPSASTEDGKTTPTSLSEAASSNSKIIPVNEDILLPFVDRPVEVRELLEQEARNRGLCNKLKEVFASHLSPSLSSSQIANVSNNNTGAPSLSFSSSTSTSLSKSASSEGGNSKDGNSTPTWQDLESILYKSREELSDQEWIDTLKLLIFPKSTALWERLRACLGIDVDDEQGGDRFEELSSDFNPGPSSSSALFSPSSHSHSQAQLQPGTGTGAGDVFSFISPNRGPAPALHEDMLSPRAVLRTHNNANTLLGNTGTTPISIPGASPNLSSTGGGGGGGGAKYSPLAYASPGFGSMGVSPVPSPGPALPAPHRQFDRTAILGGTGNQLTSSVSNPDIAGNRSPSKTGNPSLSGGVSGNTAAGAGSAGSGNGGGGGDSARMHRRTSSGGSSFRRSFAMSSISEDAPVHDFGTTPTSTSGGPSTPSSTEPVDIPNTSSGDQTPYFGGGSSVISSTSTSYGDSASLSQPQQIQQQNYPLHGSALSSSGSSSFLPSMAVAGHSSVHGQALPSPSSFNSGPAFPAATSSLGLQVDTPPLQPSSTNTTPNLSRSPSWNLGLGSAANPARIGASHSFSGTNTPSSAAGFAPSSPSFNSTYNKRAYDEYNPVFESDDGSSVAGSVRSTGRGPGMRRSFGQADALSPIRGPAQRASGGFALAGVNTKKASPKTGSAFAMATGGK